jgi:hypothetical protein
VQARSRLRGTARSASGLAGRASRSRLRRRGNRARAQSAAGRAAAAGRSEARAGWASSWAWLLLAGCAWETGRQGEREERERERERAWERIERRWRRCAGEEGAACWEKEAGGAAG